MRRRGPRGDPVRLHPLPRSAGHAGSGDHARSCSSAWTLSGVRGLLFYRSRGRNRHAHLLFLDARRLSGELTQVVELGPADPAPAHDDNIADHRAVHGEYPLDAHSVGDLTNRESLADPAAPTRDAHSFECLDALFVAFLDPHVHSQCIARTEGWQIAAQPGFLSFDEGVHKSARGWAQGNAILVESEQTNLARETTLACCPATA